MDLNQLITPMPALNPPHFSAILAPMKQTELPISPPDWNPAAPLESFKHFARSIHEQAKGIMLKDKNHGEMFFFLPLNGQGHLVLWQKADRDRQAEWVRKHINEHYSYGVIHICEAWAHFAKQPNEHTLKQLQAGEMKVSELRPEDRTEVLMVSAQSRDGYAHSWSDEILRNKASGSLWLGGCRECEDFAGRFGKLFG